MTEAAREGSREVVVFALFDIDTRHRAWGWWQFVVGRHRLRQVPGLRFGKLLGSGQAGGFGLKPSASIQGLFAVFEDAAGAAAFCGPTGLLQQWRRRAREHVCLRLRTCSARGSWDGARLAVTAPTPADGPIVSLTRASIHPARAAGFWRMEPAAERSLAEAAGCLLAVGVGEAPLLRQATFTVWSGVEAMNAYARHGAHLAAIRAAADHAFFTESMFVRFAPEHLEGCWRGRPIG